MCNVEEIDLKPFMTTAPIISSFGDLTRLGYLESFRPSAQSDALVVDDVDFTIRVPLPGTSFSVFEYDGKLRLRMCTGRKFASEGEMEIRERIVKELFEEFIGGSGRSL